jgi:hypothetical protein
MSDCYAKCARTAIPANEEWSPFLEHLAVNEGYSRESVEVQSDNG